MISPNGYRCPPDCLGSQRACIKQSRSASGQRNRERKGVVVLVGYTAEEYVFLSKQEPDCRFTLEVQFHFLCSCYKLTFKVSDKDEGEDMHCNLQVGNVK